MVLIGWKGGKRAAGLFRRDPDRLSALPCPGQHVAGEAREQVGRQLRLLQGEGMIGARNDDERAVGNMPALPRPEPLLPITRTATS